MQLINAIKNTKPNSCQKKHAFSAWTVLRIEIYINIGDKTENSLFFKLY